MTRGSNTEAARPHPAPTTRLALAALAATLLATGLVLLPVAAQAGDQQDQRVRVRDLDLTTKRGQRMLERRVLAAIEAACTPDSAAMTRYPRYSRAAEDCRADALRQVQRQLGTRGIPLLADAPR